MLDDGGRLSWIFGHGSLMFRPQFPYVRRDPASVEGWERRYGQPSVRNWGTPGAPAPTSSLVPGGSVAGIAFGVAPDHRRQVLDTVSRREAQDPIEVTLEVGGTRVSGLTWPMTSVWAHLTADELAVAALDNVASGGGPSGHALDYLNGVAHVLASIRSLDGVTGGYRAAVGRLVDPAN
jgi:cation transport protein ChaC